MNSLAKVCSLSVLLLWSVSALATHHDHIKVGEPLDLKPDKSDSSLSDACKKSVPFPTRKAKNPAPGAETNLPPPLFEAMRDCPVDKRYHPRPFIEKEKETKIPVVLGSPRRVIKNTGPVGSVVNVQHTHGPHLQKGPVGPVGSVSCSNCNVVGPNVKGPFIGVKPLVPLINVPGPGLIKRPHSEYFVDFYFYKDPGIRINPILLGN